MSVKNASDRHGNITLGSVSIMNPPDFESLKTPRVAEDKERVCRGIN
jgi:hypothetical protein